jgi:hypothetical protein
MSEFPAVAFAGMIVDCSPDDIDSFIQAEASAEVPFGAVVAQYSGGDNQARLPAASNAKLVGIVVHSHNYDPYHDLGTTGVKAGKMISVMRKGRIWVTSETANAPLDRLFVRYATGAGGTQLGAVRNATVVNEMIDATTQGVFRTTCLASGLCVLEVDFTNKP